MNPRPPGKRKAAALAARAREIIAELDGMPMGDDQADPSNVERARTLAEELARLAEASEVRSLLEQLPDSQGRNPSRVEVFPDTLVTNLEAIIRRSYSLPTGAEKLDAREALRLVRARLEGFSGDLGSDDVLWVRDRIEQARDNGYTAGWLRTQCERVDARFLSVPTTEWEAAASGAVWPGRRAKTNDPTLMRAAYIVMSAGNQFEHEQDEQRREDASKKARSASSTLSRRRKAARKV